MNLRQCLIMKNIFIYINIQIFLFTLCLSIKTIYSAAIEGNPSLNPRALSIDLGTCSCLPKSEICEVTITKSLILTETPCLENFNYCCKGRTKPPPIPLPENDKNSNNQIMNETTKEKSESIRLSKTNGDPAFKTETTLPLPPQTKEQIPVVVKIPKPQKDCSCTARNECEEKYTDYSFGFFCTHSQVHCCPPKILVNIQDEKSKFSSDRFIIATHDRSTEPCRCVPEGECRKNNNNDFGKRKDTLCPFNLIECCGTEITKKSDTVLGDIDSLGLVDGRGMGVSTNGQKGFNKPIQLPELKIPGENGKDVELLETSTTSTIAPPDLPSHYHNQEETNSGHFYGHRPGLRPIQRTPYYGSQPPYWQQPPSNYYQSERSSGPSFSDSVWNFLFTG